MTNAKYTLRTPPSEIGGTGPRPATDYALDSKNIYCNETPFLPGDKPDYNIRLYVIGNETGAICAVWARHESAAMNVAVNLNALDALLSNDQTSDAAHSDESLISLGNAGELFHGDNLFCDMVEFDVLRDWEVLKAFARCEDNDTLDY